MKNAFFLLSLMLLVSCSAGKNSGMIITINQSDKNASNIQVGTHYIGYLAAGQSSTIYFVTEEKDGNAAQIYADEFNLRSGESGKINLLFNHIYRVMLTKNTESGVYEIRATGEEVGNPESIEIMYNQGISND